MTDATHSPQNETPGSSPNNPQTTTSEKKAESNRHNAEKSTGPRTEQGKANSRLNALKHGILASQGAITMIEGRENRGQFAAMADGLAEDFQPVGTYEQLLVQEIAACFWRKRRLLTFENRAAFQVRDRPVTALVNNPHDHAGWRTAFYLQGGKLVTTDQVYDAAGLSGITLPDEADTMRVIRYEAAINRTPERAVRSLREMRAARRGASVARAEFAPAMDRAAARRNASREEAMLLAPLFSINAWNKFAEIQEEADRAREQELRGQLHGEDSEADQTKPKKVITDEIIDDMRRSMYRGIYGREMPEEPPEDAAQPEADPTKPPST